MYRAFAPFFEGVRGDRRVTGTAQGERGRLGGIRERLQKKEMAFLLKEIRIMRIIGLRESVVGKIILIIPISFKNLLWVFLSTIQVETDGVTMRRDGRRRLVGEFSRESVGREAHSRPNVCLRH